MQNKRVGKATVKLQTPVSIVASACIAGAKEGKGPLSSYYDEILNDDMYDEKTWERAESKLQKNTLQKLITKSGKSVQEVDYIFAGDLLNQCAGTHYALSDTGIPFFGLYGACSTMAESLSLAAMLIDGGFADATVAMTSSHFCSSEKQFRFPLEYGGQRTPTAQWTVTGSGAAMLSACGKGPYVTHVTTGKIVDMGITDINNMGAAMAPAAVDTITTHFSDLGIGPEAYDLIITGDLGKVGWSITKELLLKDGFDVSKNYDDCGKLVFDIDGQDVHAGGSGCGCSAITFCGYIMERLRSGHLNNVLLVCTGALMSPVSLLQGESIPGIAHAVTIQRSPGI